MTLTNTKSLFCIHGFGGSSHDFDPLLDCCRPRLNIVGLNLSPTTHLGKIPLSDPAEPIELSADTLAGTPLLGYSMGGRVAIDLVLRQQIKPSHLILIGASPGYRSEPEYQERCQFEKKVLQNLQTKDMANFERWWRTLPPILSQAAIPQPYLNRMLERRLNNRSDHLKACLRRFGSSEMTPNWSRLRELNVPTLLLVGSEDTKYLQIATAFQLRCPNAILRQVSHCGHAPHMENPRSTASHILEFLNSA